MGAKDNNGIRGLILAELEKKGRVRVAEITAKTGFSRAYVHRFFRELVDEGVLALVGRANQARYVSGEPSNVAREKARITRVNRVLRNRDIAEDLVLESIKKESGIFAGLPANVADIVDYAFTEMLNNAIEHSGSREIRMQVRRVEGKISFTITDQGVGAFQHIRLKKDLPSVPDAIRELMKGKLTTMPEAHSGEGIFFTARAADLFSLASSGKALVFNNIAGDVFIRDSRKEKGTRVAFTLAEDARREITGVFGRYTDETYEFSRTEIRIRLYQQSSRYVSRSQARRVLTGLEKFKTVVLDFHGVETVGQGFADEVFRVWQGRHPGVRLVAEKMNENVAFMVARARQNRSPE